VSIHFQRCLHFGHYFLKKSVKKACFSWFSGNSVYDFFPKSNQFCYNRKYIFVQTFVGIRRSFRVVSCLRTPLPQKKLHTSSIFHDRSKTEVRSGLSRLKKVNRLSIGGFKVSCTVSWPFILNINDVKLVRKSSCIIMVAFVKCGQTPNFFKIKLHLKVRKVKKG
jgi:hypothetical protein